jgi:hypothetical protein
LKNIILCIVAVIVLLFTGLIYLGHPYSTLSLVQAGFGLFEERVSVSYEDKSDTLAGIDNDGNGVRDDVERFIKENTKDYDDEYRAIFYSYAKSLQSMFVVDENDERAMRKAVVDKSRRVRCVFSSGVIYNANKKINSDEFYMSLKQLLLNTKERESKYFKMSKSISREQLEPYKFIAKFSEICGVRFNNENKLIAKMYYNRNNNLRRLERDLKRALVKYPDLISKKKSDAIVEYYKSFKQIKP